MLGNTKVTKINKIKTKLSTNLQITHNSNNTVIQIDWAYADTY